LNPIESFDTVQSLATEQGLSMTPGASHTQPMPTATVPKYELWIGGEERPAVAGTTFSRTSPYDGQVVGEFANASTADTETALAAAREAFDRGPWPQLSAQERHLVLNSTADLLRLHTREYAERIVLETGKPVTAAEQEVIRCANVFDYYAGAALAEESVAINHRVPTAMGMILKEPVGVVSMITPWNFPLAQVAEKVAAALAAGCTVVAKPSHLGPSPAFLLARHLQTAGLPNGVFNVVTSDLDRGATVGQVLASSPLVDKVIFTGSTQAGRAVMSAAAATTKRLSLELGGKSANIVFADADFDAAVRGTVRAFTNLSGQWCAAGTRLLVERSIQREFVAAVAAEAGRHVLDDPRLPTTTMGPLISAPQFQRVSDYIAIARAESRLVCGGGRPEGADETSLFVAPTIFDDVARASVLSREEVFGPVLAVIPFDNEDEAVEIANASMYGLAGAVWTGSISTALRVAKAIRTGKLFVNNYSDAGLENMPHGGYKQSGFGRELSGAGLAEYQELKTVQIRL
jgi:acyl-CoA reductase-like NAD-dependent aldehyde dehydrogenase